MSPTTDKSNSFNKKNRLSRPKELYSIYKKGQKTTYSWLSLSYAGREKGDPKSVRAVHKLNNYSTLGILIKKKIFTRAVDRNRFKRIVREFFRTERKRLKRHKPFSVIVCAEKRPPSIQKAFFRKELENLFKKGGLL